MRDAHPLEQAVGVEYYVSDAPGTGGRLKATPADFRVRELETVEPEPLDADRAAYPHLVLRVTLEGWDTNDFARALSNRLGIGRERVAWAGTKDKRAVSTQLVTVRGVDPDDLPSLPNVSLEPVGRLGRGLAFGDLAGNAFTVRVRDATAPGNVAEVDEELRAFGDGRVAVPNYFGQQRFGSRRPVTHEVGFRIVDRDWEAAVLAYVANPHDAEPDDTRAARAYIAETRDWQGGLDRMPNHLRFERAILHRLVENGDAYRDALDALPANLQRLFVHAAQSAIFNRVLSRRLDRGIPFTAAVAGDVVCFGTEVDGLVVPDPDRAQRVTPGRVDTVNRHVERGRAFVTAPLVGTGTDLGDGAPGEIERDTLDEYGVSPGDFDLPDPYGSTGTRRAIAIATDVSIEEAPLGFEFSLPKGSYATVVLREYLKVPPAALDGSE